MKQLAAIFLLLIILFGLTGPAYAYQDLAAATAWLQVDLVRAPGGDGLLAEFIDDALYRAVNADADPANDVDLVLVGAGAFQADACANPASCHPTGLLSTPYQLTPTMLAAILSTGDTLVTGAMSGAQIADALNQGTLLAPAAVQPSRLRYHFYRYTDALPGPQPWAWGAFSVEIKNRSTGAWEALDAGKTYRVGVNASMVSSLASSPASFQYLANPTSAGSLLDLVSGYVVSAYPQSNPYKGPTGSGKPDGRIQREGTDASGSVVPLTILHHNDSHGYLVPGAWTNPKTGTVNYYPGYTQLAALISQERAHNPTRTLLLSAGDNLQGDAMDFYFRFASLGYTADTNPIINPDLKIHPFVKAFNAMQYTAMTLGNHEFSFGAQAFSNLAKATFPILQANISDDGRFGLAAANVRPYIETTAAGIRVAVMGIGNNGVASSELPEHTRGLTFSNPISAAQSLAPTLASRNDVVIALTHIGFTLSSENPAASSDTGLARTVPDISVVIGGHSHTQPATGAGAYRYLPAMEAAPNGTPVLVSQAHAFNDTLGEVVLGLLPDSDGGYAVVSEAGRAIKVVNTGNPATSTPEDPTIKALLDPYSSLLNAYLSSTQGSTAVPLDGSLAFIAETNSADLQADAAKWGMINYGQAYVPIDLALLGASSNLPVAPGATPASPGPITVRDLFTAVPEDSMLVVLSMNGPQIKRVLERAYRNYWYYKYVPGYGGYEHDTYCMVVPDSAGHVQYLETPPNGNNVRALTINGAAVDFNDAARTYNIVTLEELVTGECNNMDNGKTIWPLNAIVTAANLYARDALILYLREHPGVSPQVTGRLGWTRPIWLPFLKR